MCQSILLIYNPASGYLISNMPDNAKFFFEEQLVQHCQANKISLTLLRLDSATTESIAGCLQRLKPDQVWVAGGDGTVLSVAKETVLLGIPIGVIPCGTMNLLARDMGMSLDVEQAIKQLCNAEVRKIDMAELNGQPFLCLSNIGMSTRLTDQRERLRKNPGWMRWPLMLWYMIKFMFAYPTLCVHIKLGDQVHSVRTRSISISNNLLAPQSSLVPERKRLDCGILGIYVAKDSSIWSLPRLILRLFSRNWQHDKDLVIFKADKVRINFLKPKQRIKVMSDGELRSEIPPLEYELKPAALKILRPIEQL
ncbi:diacylglycerol kinase family protein [Motiliproteus sp. MSK22-1]|uniref:diacylglycerol/lipid kinase family protein n=1 Tax=Motiliproteus sp. MSK22-1 TaxID=1897630 RepID=UPI000975E3A8|nr:diacylglycerol kinase family protein [Motiliproteus sp. MSK22-1]OMH31655.1 hypothetical protein BGP75_16115 [Motiliproteus sp. MSK22-1]